MLWIVIVIIKSDHWKILQHPLNSSLLSALSSSSRSSSSKIFWRTWFTYLLYCLLFWVSSSSNKYSLSLFLTHRSSKVLHPPLNQGFSLSRTFAIDYSVWTASTNIRSPVTRLASPNTTSMATSCYSVSSTNSRQSWTWRSVIGNSSRPWWCRWGVWPWAPPPPHTAPVRPAATLW